jgi:hypothetical protein
MQAQRVVSLQYYSQSSRKRFYAQLQPQLYMSAVKCHSAVALLTFDRLSSTALLKAQQGSAEAAV